MGEKKESGIAKLIELLNEYHHFNSDLIYYGWDEEYERVYFHSEIPEKEKEKLRKAGIYNEEDDGVDEDWIGDEWICSKKFGFIKWLVENDKIDREQKTKEFRLQIELDNGSYGELGGEARLLMLLSISDTPIEDLCGYLKDDSNITKGEIKIGSENQDTQELDMTTTHIEGKEFLA